MIGLGVENTMIVSSSKDGKTFDKLGEYDFTAEPSRDTDGIKANPAAIGALQDETFAFDKPVTARYFELRIHYEFNYENATDGKDIWEFIGMTEITGQRGGCRRRLRARRIRRNARGFLRAGRRFLQDPRHR